MRLAVAVLLVLGCSKSSGQEEVSGLVKVGSIEQKIVDQHSQQTFVLTKQGKEFHVRHTGPLPDTFRDQADVAVHGTLVHDNGQDVIVCDGDCVKVTVHF